jgi:DNA transformation protein and related proteins
MRRRDPTVDHLLELLAPLGEVEACRMFGGWGIRTGGLMIGLVTGEVAYLKADALTSSTFEAAGGAPFVFAMRARTVTTSYWSVPDEAMDAPAAMLPWARLALEAALRKAATKPVRKSARKSARRTAQPASSAVASAASDGDNQQCEPSARSPKAAKRRR